VSSDLDVIKAIVDAFEHSDWAEIDVRSGSLRIHLSAQSNTGAGSSNEVPAGQPAGTQPLGDDNGDDSSVAVDTADGEPGLAAFPAGAHVVLSPSPGIFWRSPLPNAPPFADLGDNVQSGTTLCIVEVMKLMNHISSDVGGIVVGVYAENGTRVDRGDALFALQPTASQ